MAVTTVKTPDVDPRVDQLKNLLYLDDDSDDQLLSLYINAADTFVHNAIGDDVNGFYESDKVKSLVDEAVVALAGTYYENRLSLSDTQVYPVDLTVNSIVGQLRGIYNSFENQDQSNAEK